MGAAFAQQMALRAEPEKSGHTASATSPAAIGKRVPGPREQYPYYVDFRARTAASYGHAFVWYGRTTDRKVEVAGLHPAGESTVPYVLGHLLPVPLPGGDAAVRIDDLGNAVYRHLDLARQLGRSDAKLLELFGEMLTGVDWGAGHKCLLQW